MINGSPKINYVAAYQYNGQTHGRYYRYFHCCFRHECSRYVRLNPTSVRIQTWQRHAASMLLVCCFCCCLRLLNGASCQYHGHSSFFRDQGSLFSWRNPQLAKLMNKARKTVREAICSEYVVCLTPAAQACMAISGMVPVLWQLGRTLVTSSQHVVLGQQATFATTDELSSSIGV